LPQAIADTFTNPTQNQSYAAEALDCRCCAIGGYYQNKADTLIGVDGNDEFTVLCASVGHIPPEEKNWLDRFPDTRDNPEFYSKRS
jgi:nitroreductase